ncbi:MAG: LamG-like jellyroll fold domain-containing protein, partial [Bacteroidota bacterium]
MSRVFVFKAILMTFLMLQGVFAINTNAQVPNYVPTNGLVGYWPFNGNANDESGNGNDGVVNGATLTQDRFGNLEKSYLYNEPNDIIFTQAILDASSDFTFTTWVNSSSNTNQTILNTIPHTIIGYGINPWWGGIGNIGFLYGSGDSFGWINNSYYFNNPIPYFETWVNHTIVKSGNLWMFYENSTLVNTYIAQGQPASIMAQLVFGHCDPAICDETFVGSIDDIGIWNRALTPEEIQSLYTGEPIAQAPCPTLDPALQNGLVGYWPFCGNANDESGNGNDGVVNGSMPFVQDRNGEANSAIQGGSGRVTTNSNVFNYGYNQSYSVSVWFTQSQGAGGRLLS